VHFQIDESEFPEQARFSVVVSFPAQPLREDGCDRTKTLASPFFGLDESVV
jgi:hypothetical protein